MKPSCEAYVSNDVEFPSTHPPFSFSSSCEILPVPTNWLFGTATRFTEGAQEGGVPQSKIPL
jgi:hypothetical protein